MNVGIAEILRVARSNDIPCRKVDVLDAVRDGELTAASRLPLTVAAAEANRWLTVLRRRFQGVSVTQRRRTR